MSNVCLTFAVYHGNILLRREALTQNIIRIGNDPRSQLRLDDPTVARMHAVLEVAPENDVTLIDLGYEAGTYVNGARVNKCRLNKGDELRIGDTRLVLERLAEQVNDVVPATQPAVVAANRSVQNPFMTDHRRIFAAIGQGPVANDGHIEEHFTYKLIRSGPDVNPQEVELIDVNAVEVMVLWGQNVLHVAHLRAGESFTLGEEQGSTPCDFFMPVEKLGTTRLPIVVGEVGSTSVVIPENATGRIELAGQAAMTLSEIRNRPQHCAPIPGGHRLPLTQGTKLSIELADFVIRVAAVNAGKPCKKGLAAGVDWTSSSYFAMALGAVGGLVAAMAFFTPTLAEAEDSDVDQDQLYLMQQYMVSIAERERESNPTDAVAEHDADNREGGTGTRAKAEEGAMGSPTSRATNHRYAVAGRRDNPDPHLAREAALRDAKVFGLIGLLNSGIAGDPNAPTAPWGGDNSLGTDAVSYKGNMWGDDLGEAFGANGLGLSGLGEGGGGRGEGIGLGTIGGLGNGAGLGDGQGFGNGNGRLGRAHKTKAPSSMRIGKTEVSGRLPPEVIQRIVRQNYGRFRMCYEQGLARNPNLEGRVQVRFVINREGLVTNVQNGGSDLPDSGVTSCIIGAYYGLSFPQPEGGIVTVSYPIMFQPG
jgi:pSer/pThr/pTyr-binding forkhead associated (FHA) protein